MPINPLSAALADMAEEIVNTLVETHYVFRDGIDADTGVYDCDCSIFAGYVLKTIDANHFNDIPQVEAGRHWPRAFEYYNYFSGLATTPAAGWKSISHMAHAHRGDMMAWSTGVLEAGKDTGHVVFLAEKPVEDDSGNFTVRVYDSANKAHFEDTRGPGEPFPDGVGSGFITFEVDEDGAPIGFLFSPNATEFDLQSIAIARPEPIVIPEPFS